MGPAADRAGDLQGGGADELGPVPVCAVQLGGGDRQGLPTRSSEDARAVAALSGERGVAGVAGAAGARDAVRVHPGWRDVVGDEAFARIVARVGGGA